MEYRNLMGEAARVFNERNQKYGDMQVGMNTAAQIASLITGYHLTPHDVALVLHAVKLSRLNNDRVNPDNYMDGINYLAFAGELVGPPEQYEQAPPEKSLEESIAIMTAVLEEIKTDAPQQDS